MMCQNNDLPTYTLNIYPNLRVIIKTLNRNKYYYNFRKLSSPTLICLTLVCYNTLPLLYSLISHRQLIYNAASTHARSRIRLYAFGGKNNLLQFCLFSKYITIFYLGKITLILKFRKEVHVGDPGVLQLPLTRDIKICN